jgi:hypothetical protein
LAATRALLTFAFVKDEFDRTGDFVRGLIPLFRPLFQELGGKRFDPAAFSQKVQNYYGLRMHPWVAEEWAPRFEEAGFLTSQGDIYNRTYTCNVLARDDFDATEHEITTLLDEIVSYVLEQFQIHGRRTEKSDAERSVILRLQKLEFMDLILKPQHPRIAGNPLTLAPPPHDGTNDTDALYDYIVADKILQLHTDSPEKFKLVASIASGAVVSEVVLGLRTPPRVGQRAVGTVIYLDSPFVVDLLDISDRKQFEYASMLIDDIKKTGATLRTYAHNVEEIRHIIHSTLDGYGRVASSVGTVAHRLRTDPNAVSRARSIYGNTRKQISALGIQVVDMDQVTAPKASLYPDSELTDLIGQIRPYGEIFAREVDAKSIVGVSREVLGRTPKPNILALPAVFLSKNSGLVKKANHILRTQRNYNEDAAPPFVSDRQMAGLLWLALGGSVGELTEKQLLANCTMAVSPRKDVLGTVFNFLASVDEKSAGEFEVLMTEDRCAHYVMDYTLGDAELVTQDNVFDILEGVKRRAVEDVTAKQKAEFDDKSKRLQEERLQAEAELNAQIARRNCELESHLRALSEAEKQAATQAQEIEKAKSETERLRRRSVEIAVRAGVNAERVAKIAIVLVISVALAVIGIVVSELAGAIDNNNFKMIIYGIGALILVGLTAATGWIVPDFLFKDAIKGVRNSAYLKSLAQQGASNEAGRWKIDWDKQSVNADF